MKIRFEDDLTYQLEAIQSVVDLFKGQENNNTIFTVEKTIGEQIRLGVLERELGIGNNLLVSQEMLLKNLNDIQVRNGLPQTKKIKNDEYHFSIEMETGTGKTYIYLRTIIELNKKYGFTKFIVVVPSIAIKEGVYKTLEITKDHFKRLYDNVPYDYFVYDSKKIDLIRNFAVNDTIQIMIINIDAFNKDSNIIKQERDQANGYRPIDYIQQCHPVVIIDEPQNMESEKAKEAIKDLNPLFTLRYSATHKEKYNPIFKLDSIDAYEKQLVKQIEVATIGVTYSANTEYIRVTSIKTSKTGVTAKLELDVKSGSRVVRKEVSVKKGDRLNEKAKREIYDGYIVNEITINEEDSSKSFIDLGKIKLTLGQLNGGNNPDTIKRLQIRKTIQEHLNKQKRLKDQGIKVLSLFFIDKVANYRIYDPETGEPKKGKYALMFEEEYYELIQRPEYHDLGTLSIPLEKRPEVVHDGYFSMDKKKSKNGKEYFEEKDTKGNTNADNDTFNKIMRDKERLLSFDEPLSFIFSHSALKEGWDNPNVFQICTLNESTSEIKKRQEIGRGLRIAVNQYGERVCGFEVNTLTVMVNESYEQFVENLQKEMEKEENIKFGVIENHIFANIVTDIKHGKEIYLGHEKSEEIFNYLLNYNYINSKGKFEEKLKIDLNNGKILLPESLKPLEFAIIKKLKSTIGKLIIKNANDKKDIKVNKKVLLSPEFKELWDKVKYKTTYQVNFDEKKLIEKCIESIDNKLYIPSERFLFEKKTLKITQGGIEENKTNSNSEDVKVFTQYRLPDIVSYLQNETNLTRKSIVEILTNTHTLNSFKKNPQMYLEQVTDIIKRTMRTFIVDGIKYEKIGDSEYYCQELFETNDLFGYLKDEINKNGNMIESSKSPYSHIVIDSNIEGSFAQKLENNSNVLKYTKLPNWFKIATPLGNYNPDWTVLVKPNLNKDEEKLYFIVETKGSLFEEELRETENLKIKCGREHFKAINTDIGFEIANNFDNFFNKIYK